MYGAHSKCNASNTPKEKIALRQVKGMKWPRPITSFSRQSAQMRDVGRTCMGVLQPAEYLIQSFSFQICPFL